MPAFGGWSRITVKFQFHEVENKNACCDELNLDTISQTGVGGGGGACTGISVGITETSGTLEALAAGMAGTWLYKWYRNGLYVSAGDTLVTNGVYGEYRVEATNTGCYTSSSIYIADPCDAMTIDPVVTGNSINASIENEIPGTTYSLKLNGVEVATSLPYTALASGVYYIYATNGTCKKVAGVYVTLQNEDCDFTIGIDQTGNQLEATTDAVGATFEWEFEDADGRVAYAATQAISMGSDGIYWLTITSGTCEKETYYLKDVNAAKIINVLTRQTGYEFNVFDISLGDITDPANELEVLINGVTQIYTASTPVAGGYYTITAGLKIAIWSASPITNGTVKVTKL